MTLPDPVMLYDTPRAPNPRRVRIFLAEKGLELPVTPVDIMAGTQFSAQFQAKVGSHNVPALELSDGTVLTETVAICRYLEALYPEPNLMGRNALEAAKIEMWSRRVEFLLMMPVAAVARHGIPAMASLEHNDQCPEWAKANESRVAKGLDWLEASLQGKDFLAGNEFSVADITAICTMDFMRLIRRKAEPQHVAVLAWTDRCRARGTIVD